MNIKGEWQPGPPDAALAVGLAGFAVLSALIAPEGIRDLDALAFGLLVLSALMLVGRRRAPVAVLIGSMACVFAYQLRGYPDVPPLPVLVAIYSAVREGRERAAGVVTVAGLVLSTFAVNHSRLPDETMREVIQGSLLIAGWLVAAAVLAMAARHRQAYVEQIEERAAEAERTREEAALRRAGEERLRIARELHDSLTHNISVIKVQAGVAVHLARKRGEEVPDALIAIQDTSAEAVRELRSTLDVLRNDADSGAHTNGLGRIEALLDRTRLAGTPATLTVSGAQRPLPPDVDQAAYRIVQEALTNVTRHAGPTTATVEIGYGPDQLTVQVDDDGAARVDEAPVPGIGLIGMRERVTALGGRLLAEPRADGGFTVRAELPLSERVEEATEAT